MPPTYEQEETLAKDALRWLNLYKQANNATKAGKHKRAEQLRQQMLKMARVNKEHQLQWAADRPDIAEKIDLCMRDSLLGLGFSHLFSDKENPAIDTEAILLEALDLLEKFARDGQEMDYHHIFQVCAALAKFYEKRSDIRKCEEIARRTLNYKEKQVGQWDLEIVPFLNDLAWTLEEQKKYDECYTLRKDVLSILQNDPDIPQSEMINQRYTVSYTGFLKDGMGNLESVQKALATLSPEERKVISGEVAAELQSMLK